MTGTIDVVVGLAVLAFGVGLAAAPGGGTALPLGLAISIVGVMLLLSGLGRMTARLEVTGTGVAWTWSFSRHELAFDDLDDAALVEKGSPASGGAWAGVLGGGFVSAVAWWLLDTVSAFVHSEPSLGSVELVLIKRYGGPVEVKPISAWSTRSSHSQANEALGVVQTAIAGSARPAPHRLPILRDDAWEQPGELRG
jgi:hypothetical protein